MTYTIHLADQPPINVNREQWLTLRRQQLIRFAYQQWQPTPNTSDAQILTILQEAQ